jgi:hypothetical protein
MPVFYGEAVMGQAVCISVRVQVPKTNALICLMKSYFLKTLNIQSNMENLIFKSVIQIDNIGIDS